jgi:hypothetical protein
MPDGSVKYVHVAAHALTDESGSIEFVGAVMDVSTAKQWKMHCGPASGNGEMFLREITVDAKLFGTRTQS